MISAIWFIKQLPNWCNLHSFRTWIFTNFRKCSVLNFLSFIICLLRHAMTMTQFITMKTHCRWHVSLEWRHTMTMTGVITTSKEYLEQNIGRKFFIELVDGCFVWTQLVIDNINEWSKTVRATWYKPSHTHCELKVQRNRKSRNIFISVIALSQQALEITCVNWCPSLVIHVSFKSNKTSNY